MNDFETVSKELLSKGKKDVEELVNSPTGKQISEIVDGQELKKAISEGDQATMSRILNQVMSTDAGKELVKTVSNKFGNIYNK